MTTIKNTTFALAIGLLASTLASPSSMAQMAKPATGLTPGQPFVLSISSPDGQPVMVVAGGHIPLLSEPRIALFLPDLESLGGQEEGGQFTYTLSTQGPAGLTSETLGKPQHVVGRVHKEYVKSPAGPTLGAQGGTSGGSILLIGAGGLQLTPVIDIADDIVWIDSCVHGAYEVAGAGTMATAAEGILEGGGAGSLNVATSAWSAKAP
jgi:hypothetical protein